MLTSIAERRGHHWGRREGYCLYLRCDGDQQHVYQRYREVPQRKKEAYYHDPDCAHLLKHT